LSGLELNNELEIKTRLHVDWRGCCFYPDKIRSDMMAKKSVTGTIAQLADTALVSGTQLSVTDWSVLTRILQGAKCARILGEQKPESGKGRTSKVWEIDAEISLKVSK
jgi:hypothetical protein